jgi:GT2 family glycosyltransferase
MLVSFVIPTRNQARFLRRCIESCISQGIADSEILVIDGLSTDGTQEILRSYGERVRWVSEKDQGQADAVNKGVPVTRLLPNAKLSQNLARMAQHLGAAAKAPVKRKKQQDPPLGFLRRIVK